MAEKNSIKENEQEYLTEKEAKTVKEMFQKQFVTNNTDDGIFKVIQREAF